MAVNLLMSALGVATEVGGDFLALVFPVWAVAQARPMSVWEGESVEALV